MFRHNGKVYSYSIIFTIFITVVTLFIDCMFIVVTLHQTNDSEKIYFLLLILKSGSPDGSQCYTCTN